LYRTTKKFNERRNFKKRMKEFGSRSVLPSTFLNILFVLLFERIGEVG
jgi:hypothetical protein